MKREKLIRRASAVLSCLLVDSVVYIALRSLHGPLKASRQNRNASAFLLCLLVDSEQCAEAVARTVESLSPFDSLVALADITRRVAELEESRQVRDISVPCAD